MPIVASRAVVAALAETTEANRPLLLWRGVVTINTIAAMSELEAYPATNLANPSTQSLQGWRSDSLEPQYVTVSPIASEDKIDAVGIAAHNFGSAGVTVSVERLGTAEDATWVEVFEPFIPGSDKPLLLWFDGDFAGGLRIKLVPDTVKPRAATLCVGKALVMEKGVQAGHTPLPYGRNRKVVTGLATSGAYLGRIVEAGTLRSEASIINLSPDWYRQNLDPLAADSAEWPFFWSWRSEEYPTEVGYAWLLSELIPVPAQKNGRINVTFQMEGIA